MAKYRLKWARQNKEKILNLYNHVKMEPFYANDVEDVFPTNQIQSIANNLITHTGNTRKSPYSTHHYHKQWQFTKKGLIFLDIIK